MPGSSPGKTTVGWFDASTTQPCFVPWTGVAKAVVVAPWTPAFRRGDIVRI
jgi:hypothetical protein